MVVVVVAVADPNMKPEGAAAWLEGTLVGAEVPNPKPPVIPVA